MDPDKFSRRALVENLKLESGLLELLPGLHALPNVPGQSAKIIPELHYASWRCGYVSRGYPRWFIGALYQLPDEIGASTVVLS